MNSYLQTGTMAIFKNSLAGGGSYYFSPKFQGF